MALHRRSLILHVMVKNLILRMSGEREGERLTTGGGRAAAEGIGAWARWACGVRRSFVHGVNGREGSKHEGWAAALVHAGEFTCPWVLPDDGWTSGSHRRASTHELRVCSTLKCTCKS